MTGSRLRIAALLIALATFAADRTANANGRYPAASQLVVDPKDPTHLVVRTTYGVLVTTNDDGDWGWICEAAIGYGGTEDPAIAVTGNGSILAGITAGLSVSRTGCDWALAAGGLSDESIADVSVERGNPSRASAIFANDTATVDGGALGFVTELWRSVDDGASWSKAGSSLLPDFAGLTVDVAPSDPSRVYVTGRRGRATAQGALQRTIDGGATWSIVTIPGTDSGVAPFLAAIDPRDSGTIYVRLDGDPSDTLLVSHDSGDTWSTLFVAQGGLSAFALSPDGTEIAIGGVKDGLWRAPSNAPTFERVSSIGATCFAWTERGLYACADQTRDGFEVGLSADRGATFQPLLHLQGLCGPRACPSSTAVGAMCPSRWLSVAGPLGIAPCDGADAGVRPESVGETSGCGACLAARSSSNGAALVAAALTVVVVKRRRTRRRTLRSISSSLHEGQATTC